MNATLDMNARLDDLRDEYTYRVNMLLELGREDLAAQVADQYPEDVARAQQG